VVTNRKTTPNRIRGGLVRSHALRAGTWEEATNLCCSIVVLVWPYHGRPKLVGLGHDRRVRHNNPLSVDPHTVAAAPGVPVDVLDADAVGKRTAQALSARQPVEPLLERRIGVLAVVTRGQLIRYEYDHAQRYYRQNPTTKCVHWGPQKIVLSGPLTTRSRRPRES